MGGFVLEPPSPALDGLLRSTPPQFAALGTIVAVITAAILPPRSRSLIRSRRGVRVRRRRLRGYAASSHHRSLCTRSRDRWTGAAVAAAADSRGRLVLHSRGRRAQRVLSLYRLSTGQCWDAAVVILSYSCGWIPGRCLAESTGSWTLSETDYLCGGTISGPYLHLLFIR
jgi:hypothetical protein